MPPSDAPSDMGIYLDVRRLPPTAERLSALLDLFAACGYRLLLLDWGANFPWSADQRIRADESFPEEMVSGIVRRAESLGLRVLHLFPSEVHLEFLVRHRGYRRFFALRAGRFELDARETGALQLVEELAEDFVQLVGDSVAVERSFPDGEEVVAEHLAAYLTERALHPLIARREAAASDGGGAAISCFTLHGPGAADRPLGRALCFQSGDSPAYRSIEARLDLLVERAPSAANLRESALRAEVDRARAIRLLVERIDALEDRAWRLIRVIRGALSSSVLGAGERLGMLPQMMDELDATARELRERGQALERVLDRLVADGALATELISILEPIEEERQLVRPRVALVARRLLDSGA